MNAKTVLPLSLIALAAAQTAAAQGVATDTQLLERVTITGARSATLASAAGGAKHSVTAQQLAVEKNLFNPEDALENAPGTTVRKRYIGDRNAVLGGRSFGTLQPSRALVYVDGYLISNFLGRFDAPRWNVLSPESLARVELLQGPYSALLPGNSMGSTVVVTQARPEQLQLSGRLMGARQRFSQYGRSEDFDAHQLSLSHGNRLGGGAWYQLDANRQHSLSQPMQWGTVSADAAGKFPAVSGSSTRVDGVVYDTDPKGLKRAVFGASGGAIDDSTQHTLNLRAGLALPTQLDLSGMLALWSNDSSTRNQSFLRDANGATVWSGRVSDGTHTFNILPSMFAISTRKETHRQWGATLKRAPVNGFSASLVLSGYRIGDDANRVSNLAEPLALQGGAGTVTRRDGTGWNTAEVQGVWQGKEHAVSVGLHRNGYTLHNTVAPLTDWRSGEAAPNQRYDGRTRVTALYAQDRWQFHDDGSLTLGWRAERWNTSDGLQLGGGSTVAYPQRSLSGQSPKAVLRWNLDDSWQTRLSLGRGVRFPNVEELYNGTVTATSQTLADPNLRAERSDSAELAFEAQWERSRLRLAVFSDDVADAILRQSTADASVCKTTATGASSYTCVQNVDRVRTEGIELAGGWQPLPGLSLEASFNYTLRSEVTANRRDPAMVGQWWLRVPRTRASVQASYRLGDSTLAASWRQQGRAYNDTYNLDVNPNVYGGVSSVNQFDLRGTHRLSPQLVAALGVNNLFDRAAYQSHPYPGRTVFAELRFAL
ncbi:MAG: TonB-dependent receptor [Inhella sp.]